MFTMLQTIISRLRRWARLFTVHSQNVADDELGIDPKPKLGFADINVIKFGMPRSNLGSKRCLTHTSKHDILTNE